jgi:putative transposase
MSIHLLFLMSYTMTTSITPGEYYHVLNRGVRKQLIFHNSRDYSRFLFLILFLQGEFVTTNTARHVTSFIDKDNFAVSENSKLSLIATRKIELVNFALMPNHFHLTLFEKTEGGIAKYMQRILNAYTKYYNAKYAISGHLFQGKFKRIHVESNDQLLYLSTYIHKNPTEIKGWANKANKYPWSSYQDYVLENRWGELLARDIILEQFNSPGEYQRHVKGSVAKDPDWLE